MISNMMDLSLNPIPEDIKNPQYDRPLFESFVKKVLRIAMRKFCRALNEILIE